MTEQSETLAIRALAWLAAQDDLMSVFMGSTGLSTDDLKARAADPEFLASVLDFLMIDDQWVIRFCDGEGLPYDEPMRARQGLPGGDLPHWT